MDVLVGRAGSRHEARAVVGPTTHDDEIEVEVSRALVVAAAAETRRRIERDLHDGAQQRLVALGFGLRDAIEMAPPESEGLRAHLSRMSTDLLDILDEIREIARGTRPAVLTADGLDAALMALARRSAVPVELDGRVGRRMSQRAEAAAYYLVSEALTNAAKHSQASVVHVEVAADARVLLLAIRDDGIGGADATRGSGLNGISDRVKALDGTMEVSSPAGRGTSLRITIPIRSAHDVPHPLTST